MILHQVVSTVSATCKSPVSTMRYREYLKTKLEMNLPADAPLPSGYHLVGHVALLQLDKSVLEFASDIGQTTLEFDQRVRSVAIRTGPTLEIVRFPQYAVIAGTKKTETIHVENGIKFKLDPLRITFSGGNKNERILMSTATRPHETVVDMFACVGQFILNMCKRRDVNGIAIEVNPKAFDYLEENIIINKMQNRVNAILADCRDTDLQNLADRIVMGYLHNTTEYLPHAIRILSNRGGTIHMHLACPQREIQTICNTINTIMNRRGFRCDIEVRFIKHYSPLIRHFVFDLTLSPHQD